MSDKEKIVSLIYEVIDELNEKNPSDIQIEKSPETSLLIRSGNLDSLDLVNLIVGIEQHVEETFGTPISLADEKAMTHNPNPFGSIALLTDYVSLLLEQKSDE